MPTSALLNHFTRFYNTFNYCGNNFAMIMMYFRGFLSVCPSVRPSIRPPSMSRWQLEFFSSDINFCLVYVTWVKILEGIEYEHHTSLNMCIMAGHVSIFIRPFEKRDVLCRGNVRPSVHPSVRPRFPDFSSTCFEISIWNLVCTFSRWHDMSSLSCITIGSLWLSSQPKVGQTHFLQSWPHKSR